VIDPAALFIRATFKVCVIVSASKRALFFEKAGIAFEKNANVVGNLG
jgi:hypothetical protein